MTRDARKRDRVAADAEVAAGSVEAGAEGVAKGGAEAAEQVSHFHYAPTVVALFPVFASFIFGSHSEHWTDLMLLGLVAIYLHHCVTGLYFILYHRPPNKLVPWDYYKVSRRRYKSTNKEGMTERQIEIQRQLRNAELQAFFGLLIGPLLGALLLHYVRGVMARPANGLITNFNVSVFVLAAELRPFKIAYSYLTKKSESLQHELVDVPPSHYENLVVKLEKFETDVKQLKSARESESSYDTAHNASSASSGFGRVDSEMMQIKTALRRFERYEAQLKHQYDEKIFSLERRMADFVDRPGVVTSDSGVSSVAGSIALLPFKALWTFVTVPARLIGYTHNILRSKRLTV